MGFLKKLDIFKSVNSEHKQGTMVGSFLTFCSVIFIFIFFYREMKVYRSQKLYSKLFVDDKNYDRLVNVYLDIFFHKIKCDVLNINIEQALHMKGIKKAELQQGCRVKGYYTQKPTKNTINFTTDMSTMFLDLITNSFEEQGMHVINKQDPIDFSHTINNFQFGESVSKLRELEKYYPELIKANPLNGEKYVSKDSKEGHSLFLYEMNIVNGRINGKNQILYNYNRNTINTMHTNPYVNFELNFSPISVEYDEGSENFLEFLTYLLGIIGGTLTIIRILNNLIYSMFLKKNDHQPIPEIEINQYNIIYEILNKNFTQIIQKIKSTFLI